MSFVGRVGTRMRPSEAANLAVGPLARRAILACGVAAAAFPCRDEITRRAAAASYVLTAPGGVLSGYFQEPLPDWAASNPHAVAISTFRYPPKLASVVRRMMDDGDFPPDVPTALDDPPKSSAILNDAWARVAAPGEPLAVAWETTTIDGETSTKLIDMTDRKYAKAILILCCHIRDRLAQAPDSDPDSLPQGDYDEVGRTRFAPIGAEND
jgi:hypothetical protein